MPAAKHRHLQALRSTELNLVLARIGSLEGKDLLEIGAGDGTQLRLLRGAGRCRTAIGVDLAGSLYAGMRVADVVDYDGRRLPFDDASFDIVFSSNVLEHIEDLDGIDREIKRVLRPGGKAVHVLPSPAWRFWTSLIRPLAVVARQFMPRRAQDGRDAAAGSSAAMGPAPRRPPWRRAIDVVVAPRHGERGNRFTELWYFRSAWWRARFLRAAWRIERCEPVGLFYTGESLCGAALGMARRRRLARWLGSACQLYVLTRP